ncbi:MAG: hypothetical protein R3C44_07725 [Chloroflexota bacterium]
MVLTAIANSPDEDEVTATTSATVQITDVAPVIEVNLSADPSIVAAPGENVDFTVRINNYSEADGVVINELVDETLGNLNGRGTCTVPTSLIGPGGNYECIYTDQVTGSADQEKIRTVNVSGVSDDPVPNPVSASDSITIPITDRPVQQSFFPQIVDDVVEPNNSCSTAYPLQLDREYYFLPPPTYISGATPALQDYFRFTLDESTSVVVELTNFVPRKGQLVVRTGECGSLTLLAYNPDAALNKALDLGTQEAGQYFIQIINDGPAESKQLYGLIVRTQ